MRILTALAMVSILLASGCYKIDIQQGNYLDPALVEQLRVGMSRRQVQSLLGTPLVTDPFNQQRWDYVYNYFPASDENDSEAERRRLSLFFEGEVLSRIDGELEPPLAAQ